MPETLNQRRSSSSAMNSALAGALAMNVEGRTARNPVMVVGFDSWKPFFVKGNKVEFFQCTCEDAEPGDFVVVRHGFRMCIHRMIDWKHDGSKIRIEVLKDPGDKKSEILNDGEFLGRVLKVVSPDGKSRYTPNERTGFGEFWGSLTRFGTVGAFQGLMMMLKEGWDVMLHREKPKKKAKKLGFFGMWRRMNKWSKELEASEERERKKKQKNRNGEEENSTIDLF